MTINIETGKIYITRGGDLVKVRSTTIDDGDCPVLGLYMSGRNKYKLGMWQADGSISVYAVDENDKIVSEWTNTLQYQTKFSAGLDLCTLAYIELPPFGRAVVDTGVYLKDVIPPDLPVVDDGVPCGMVCSRSGLAAKEGVIVLNAPGIIDADYEETIKVILYNTNNAARVSFSAGARIAQLVFAFTYRRPELVKDEGRQGGFGSTGE